MQSAIAPASAGGSSDVAASGGSHVAGAASISAPAATSSTLKSMQQQQQQQQQHISSSPARHAASASTGAARLPEHTRTASKPPSIASATEATPLQHTPFTPNRQQHCSFVLVAEFDIDKGSTLSHQWPEAIGSDDYMLAELMLPDGAHARAEDWTVFFLKPGRGLHAADSTQKDEEEEITHVLNLVRTKHDNTVRRGALVKAMAIGTRHPWIQVFKPALLLALDDYFATPSAAPLQRLYEALNALDLSAMPVLTREEKLILRASEQRDLFAEKFAALEERSVDVKPSLRPAPSSASLAAPADAAAAADEGETPLDLSSRPAASGLAEDRPKSPPGARPNLPRRPSAGRGPSPSLRRKLSGANALNIDAPRSRRPSVGAASLLSPPTSNGGLSATLVSSPTSPGARQRDTHWYEAGASYKGKSLPLRVPVAAFAEDVGDYSLITLHNSFSGPASTPAGPQHPHLHSNGSLTPPLVLLFNAISTGKRVIFLGHGLPASTVASHVLAACALASGGGAVFRGIIRRAFPYCNLGMMDELEKTPGYIAGVTNPRFEDLHAWDVLLNIETGRVTIAKDVEPAPPLKSAPSRSTTAMRGTFSSGSIASLAGSTGIGHDASGPPAPSSDLDFGSFGPTLSNGGTASSAAKTGKDKSAGNLIEARPDAPDVLFMEDMTSAIAARYGERYVLARWVDYASHFARLAARHEEQHYGSSSIAPQSQPYLNGQLGSGVVFADRESELREVQASAMRAEGWIVTDGCKFYCADEAQRDKTKAILGYDLHHQVARLKKAKQLLSGEAELMFTTLVASVRTPEQIIELLSHHPPHTGGLSCLSIALFHSSPTVRSATVELLSRICSHPVGRKMVQNLSVFHRLAFARMIAERSEAMGSRDAGNRGISETGTSRFQHQQHLSISPGAASALHSRAPSPAAHATMT